MSESQQYQPNEPHRTTVRTLAGYQTPHKDIARMIGVSYNTLLKYYRAELDEGLALGNAMVARSLHEQAVGRPAEVDKDGRVIREELKPDKSAAIFLGKVRLGMRETSRFEVSGPNGGPIATAEIDLSVFTDDELMLFMQLYNKAKRRREDEEGGDGGATA
jgi:hypothetical protein